MLFPLPIFISDGEPTPNKGLVLITRNEEITMHSYLHRSVPAIRLIPMLGLGLLLLMLTLNGCGLPFKFNVRTPLLNNMNELVPGISTKEDVRRLLGTPLYEYSAWGAELYSGNTSYDVIDTFMFVPVYAGSNIDHPATLLVVYEPDGHVSGLAYNGEECSFKCRAGDTKGLEIEQLDLLLTTRAESADLINISGAPESCTFIFDATKKTFDRRATGLFLAGNFKQLVPEEAFFRMEVQPGTHLLSCARVHRDISGWRPWYTLSEKGKIPATGEKKALTSMCNAGVSYHFKVIPKFCIFTTGDCCEITPGSETELYEKIKGARMVINPDTTIGAKKH